MDRDSAEVLADHILLDMEMCDGCEIEDTWWMESCFCGLKMLMLIASYYNKFGQESRAASPAFFPSRA